MLHQKRYLVHPKLVWLKFVQNLKISFQPYTSMTKNKTKSLNIVDISIKESIK